MSLEHLFPNLAADGCEVTSPASLDYNCIAWAAGENHRWWWPDEDAYWPEGVPLRSETVEAFVQAFAAIGYQPCDRATSIPGTEKVALYARGGRVTHAARQLANGKWSSKLGADVDLEHALDGLEGAQYGKVVQVLARPVGE